MTHPVEIMEALAIANDFQAADCLDSMPDQTTRKIRLRRKSGFFLCSRWVESDSTAKAWWTFFQGWYPSAQRFLPKTTAGFHIYRLIRKGAFLVYVGPGRFSGRFRWEQILNLPMIRQLAFLFPGTFIIAAWSTRPVADRVFLKISERSIFAAMSRNPEKTPFLYLKISRENARGDFPEKEQFIMSWISAESSRDWLPSFRCISGKRSVLMLPPLEGHTLYVSKASFRSPDRRLYRLLVGVRKKIEALCKVTPPPKEKVRHYLDMLTPKCFVLRDRYYGARGRDGVRAIVHGDLNPSNIIVKHGSIRFIDWEHWRLGDVFENWFDFLIRTAWSGITYHRFFSDEHALTALRETLAVPWVRNETFRLFTRLAVAEPPDECLRYCLFPFLVDGVLDWDPGRLKHRLDQFMVFSE